MCVWVLAPACTSEGVLCLHACQADYLSESNVHSLLVFTQVCMICTGQLKHGCMLGPCNVFAGVQPAGRFLGSWQQTLQQKTAQTTTSRTS